MMPLYTLIPQDVLFFRDGRPIDAVGGHGARWPAPSLIFDALHAALHRAFPFEERQSWEHAHRFGRSSDRDPARERTQRFGSLSTAGLFPVLESGDWLFPAPQDALPQSGVNQPLLLPLDQDLGDNNLPGLLRYSLANPSLPSKDESKPWWTRAAFSEYLVGKAPPASDMLNHSDIFTGEWTTGIGMDPDSQTQDGERIYSAEYLRLRLGFSLGFAASLPMKQDGSTDDVSECMNKLFSRSSTLVVGGQQRVCTVKPVNHGLTLADILPLGTSISGNRVKWILLSPAIYPEIQPREKNGAKIWPHPGGWLPTWIANGAQELDGESVQAGDVLLRDGPGLEKAKRKKLLPGRRLKAKLVAARIPKPIVLTGWSERLHLLREKDAPDGEALQHGPRSTHLAVPAGSVYYFETESAEEARKLAAALNWHGNDANPSTIQNRRSALMGEKGFGLGVCGTWRFYGD